MVLAPLTKFNSVFRNRTGPAAVDAIGVFKIKENVISTQKGFSPWKPNKETQVFLDEVLEVINDQRDYWLLKKLKHP